MSERASVGIADADVTVEVGWAVAANATLVTESLVLGTAVSTVEIITDT